MTANGWAQIALYFVVLTALVVPLGRFMARVFEGERTFLSPVFRPVEGVLYRAAGVDETREQHWLTYTVAMLLFNAAGFLAGLRAATLPGGAAAQSCGHVRGRPGPRLQYRRQLYVEHQLAELRRREHDELPHPDGGAHHPELRVRRYGHRARHRAHPRLRAGLGQDGRQFLGRPDAVHFVRAAAALARRRRSSSSGRACRRTSDPMSMRPRSKARRRRSARGRQPRRSRSSSSAPTAAASGTPTRPCPTRTRRRSATSSRCSTSC